MGFLQRFPYRVIIALSVQFVLGMIINMFVEFPPDGSTAANWEFAMGSWLIVAHILIGAFILIGAIAYFAAVVAKKQKQLVPYALTGLVAILAAFIGGERFVSVQLEGYSLLMALGFLFGLLAYGAATHVVRVQNRTVRK